MKKMLFRLLALGLLLLPGVANAGSLTQFYAARGQKLPSIAERAVTAAQLSIPHYIGSYGQNIELEKRLVATAPSEDNVGFSVVTNYRTTLQSSMSATQANVPVSSITTFDGTVLTMDLLGSKVFLTIEPGSVREDITMCTAITSGQFSGCTRGLAFSGTSTISVANNRKAHNAGSTVVMSNVHYVYEQYIDLEKDQSAGGQKTFTSSTFFTASTTFGVLPISVTSTPVNPGDLITFNYLSSVTSTGCSNASNLVRGCVQEAAPNSYSATGTTGARQYVNPTNSATTSAGVGSADLFVRLRASDGKLDSSLGGGNSSLASTDSNGLISQNPASASTTARPSGIPLSFGTGFIDRNWLSEQITATGTAGENISTSSAPFAVSQNLNDGRYYKTNPSTSTAILDFRGFAIVSSTLGNSIVVQTSGIVSGFTGLSTGTEYYVVSTTPGALTTSTGYVPNGTNFVQPVGVAVSATQFLIRPRFYNTVSLDASTSTASSFAIAGANSNAAVTGITTTTYSKIKEIQVTKTGTYRVRFDIAPSNGGGETMFGQIYRNGIAYGTERSAATGGNLFVTFAENLEFKAGDLLQLYVKTSGGSPSASAKNLQVFVGVDLIGYATL